MSTTNENIHTLTTPQPERRRHYRAAVIPRSTLQLRVWRIPPGVPLRQRPMPSQQLRVAVRQIGQGGLTIEAPTVDQQLANVRETDRLRIELAYGEKSTLIEGRLRGRVGLPGPDAAAAAALRTGVVFQGREADVAFREARATLATIVAAVQREELRERLREQQQKQQQQPPPPVIPSIPQNQAA